MAQLLIMRGGATGNAVELGNFATLGRDPECTIAIDDALVAQRQVEIHRLADGTYKMLDVGPTEATILNGQPTGHAILVSGDEITLGEITLRFEGDRGRGAREQEIEFDDQSVKVALRQDATAEPFFDVQDVKDSTVVRGELLRLQAAYDLTRAIGLEHDVDKVLARVLDTAFGLLDADRGGIFLLDRHSGELSSPKVRSRQPTKETIRFSRSIISRALERREAVMSLDAAADDRFDMAQSVRLGGVRSIMCVPMVWGDETAGVIYLDSQLHTGLFDEKDLQLLTTFARQAAIAVKNANLLSELQLTNSQLRAAKEAAERANEELRKTNEELEKLVVRDPLTRLYNHAYLQELVEQEIRRSERYDLSFGLMLVDIDGFRKINDALGHATGNKLLCVLADTFRQGRRRADIGARYGEQPIATRYEKDTFAVLLPETTKRGAAVTAERLREAIDNYDFSTYGISKVTISVGVAACPVDARDRPGLIAAAEVALRAAKHAGGNQTVSYARSLLPRDDSRDEAELARIVALDRLIEQASMDYVYQPIVRAVDGGILGYEALCRPRDGAFTGPVSLLSTAERTGRIGELGHVMRRLATRPLDQLEPPMLMFINLHPLELTEALVSWGQGFPSAERLVLEVTESVEITEHRRTRELLSKLKELGFRIALDDLGAGYSGLNSLAQLEPDFVKLDMRMVHNIDSDSRQARLIKYILDFADGEGMTVIAEGIETEIERKVVTDLGCKYLQGFYFARPQPPFCAVANAS